MATNCYGLDADYFIRLCAREFSPDVIRNQRPEDLARAFARAARTACADVLGEAEFAAPAPMAPKYLGMGEWSDAATAAPAPAAQKRPDGVNISDAPAGFSRPDSPPPALPEKRQPAADDAIWELESTIKDLARQKSTEYRARYLGECKGILRCIGMLGLWSDAGLTSWRVKILEAHLKAIENSEAAGVPVPEEIKARELFWLAIHRQA